MSYNGSGTFVINTAGQPVVSGTVISSTAFNALTADLATGLSTAITKDGQTTPTANIPMGNNKITGLAVGTAATDAANLSQVQSTAAKLVNSVSGADTITGTMSPNLGAYATGQMFYFVAVGANTGAVTINIDSLGAKSITRDGTTALAAGDIQSGEVCVIVYDGTQFQLVNGASQSASIVTENLTVNKATVLNESGGDNDTRIEGDTDANLFFADASTDRIGIGTSSPAAKLDVNGITQSRGNLYGGTSNTTANVLAYANVANGGAGFSQFLFANTSTETRGYLTYTHASDALLIGTAGATKATLDSSGNLGLGVTPSAWSSVTAAQILRGSIYGSNDAVGVQHNTYFDGSNWKYIASSVQASQYDQYQGGHRWFTAASGTAGNNISWTQAMTLDASGNLTLGTASASGVSSATPTYLTLGNRFANTAGDATKTKLRVFEDNAGNIYGFGVSSGLFENHVPASAGFAWYVNNTERARITSGGELCLNRTSGLSALLSITSASGNGSINCGDSADATAYGIVQITRPADQPDNKFHLSFVRAGQRVAGMGFLDNSDTFAIQNDGSNNGSGVTLTASATSWGTTSDERKKNILGSVDNAMAKMASWRSVYYRYKIDKEDAPQRIGLIAQDVQATVPEAVSVEDDEGGTLQLRYSEVIPVLVKAIQEQQALIKSLEAKVAALEAK